MGILNLTPDSFSGDGLYGDVDGALRRAEQMLEDGADILDVGGESTRPGAEAVEAEEELQRVVPVVRALAARFSVPISVDTSKSAVARAALEAGAVIINDISGLHADAAMARMVSEAGAAVVVMHIQGTPRTMQQHPHYTDLLSEVCRFLQEIHRPRAGLPASRASKSSWIRDSDSAKQSRIIWSCCAACANSPPTGSPSCSVPRENRASGTSSAASRRKTVLEGTAATVAIGIANGADIIRVHDVRQMVRVAKMTDAITRGFID